jgi:hypothetical protein
MFTTRTTALIACTTIALLGLTFPVAAEENSPIAARDEVKRKHFDELPL